jgi:hypothetical protein
VTVREPPRPLPDLWKWTLASGACRKHLSCNGGQQQCATPRPLSDSPKAVSGVYWRSAVARTRRFSSIPRASVEPASHANERPRPYARNVLSPPRAGGTHCAFLNISGPGEGSEEERDRVLAAPRDLNRHRRRQPSRGAVQPVLAADWTLTFAQRSPAGDTRRAVGRAVVSAGCSADCA